MIIVEGWMRLAEGEVERLRKAAAAMQSATRQEPGCLAYAFAIDVDDPNLARVIERWSDEAALAAHFASAHMAAFNAVLRETKILDASVKAYKAEYLRSLVGA